MEAANRFIQEVYPPDDSARLPSPPRPPESAFVRASLEQVADILCRQEEHIVGNGDTVRYNGLCLQLSKSTARAQFVKAKVWVHEYTDGSLAVFHGPGRLASHSAECTIIKERQLAA